MVDDRNTGEAMKRILVIGDAIADVYRAFEYRKTCPDAPGTPVGIQREIEVRPGGAANVAVNLAALAPVDCSIDLIAALDYDTAQAVKRLSARRVGLSESIVAASDEVLRKERIVIDGGFAARLDNILRVEPHIAGMLRVRIEQHLATFTPDLIVLSDYSGGALTDALIEVLRPHRHRLMVDTKRTDLECFSGSLLAKLNQQEHDRVLLVDHSPERYFKYYVVTCGALGARLHIRKIDPTHEYIAITNVARFPGRKVQAVDVCGCGDTFLAGLAAGLIRYDDVFEAVSFANCAAATVVTQQRTAVANLAETLEMTGREV